MGLRNSLVTPGAVSMLGTPVDLSKLTTDAYVVAGIADHISPWQACYRSAQLLGSQELRFVLSSSGHIAALVNPPESPGVPRRSGRRARPRRVAADGGETPLVVAGLVAGSGSAAAQKPPATLGGAGMAPLEPAPGSYVLQR